MTHQSIVSKLRHNYVRFSLLLGQLFGVADRQQAQLEQPQSALKHFIACTAQVQQLINRTSQRPLTNGKHKNGLHKALETVSTSQDRPFICQLQQEVERVRRFVQSYAEDLWMRLLSTADDLSVLKAKAVDLQSAQTTQYQSLGLTCQQIGVSVIMTVRTCINVAMQQPLGF